MKYLVTLALSLISALALAASPAESLDVSTFRVTSTMFYNLDGEVVTGEDPGVPVILVKIAKDYSSYCVRQALKAGADFGSCVVDISFNDGSFKSNPQAGY